MTTPLFLLRCVQLGISIRDLDLLTIGIVNDMFVESRNDEYKGWRNEFYFNLEMGKDDRRVRLIFLLIINIRFLIKKKKKLLIRAGR